MHDDISKTASTTPPRSTWGPKLFTAALAAVLLFFWWLLIYSHGVAPHH